jgi:hypothetical protein
MIATMILYKALFINAIFSYKQNKMLVEVIIYIVLYSY